MRSANAQPLWLPGEIDRSWRRSISAGATRRPALPVRQRVRRGQRAVQGRSARAGPPRGHLAGHGHGGLPGRPDGPDRRPPGRRQERAGSGSTRRTPRRDSTSPRRASARTGSAPPSRKARPSSCGGRSTSTRPWKTSPAPAPGFVIPRPVGSSAPCRLAAPVDAAEMMMLAMTREGAQQIVDNLRATVGRREVTLGRSYQRHRAKGPVIVLNSDTVMTNVTGLSFLNVEMHARLWDSLLSQDWDAGPPRSGSRPPGAPGPSPGPSSRRPRRRGLRRGDPRPQAGTA